VGCLSATGVEQFKQEGLALLKVLSAILLVRHDCGGVAGSRLDIGVRLAEIDFIDPWLLREKGKPSIVCEAE